MTPVETVRRPVVATTIFFLVAAAIIAATTLLLGSVPAVLISVVAACIATTAFPIAYWVKAPWWRRPIGRAIMFAHLSLAAAVDLTLINVLWQYDGALLVGTIVFWLIALATLNHLRLLLFPPTQRGAGHARPEAGPERPS